MVVSKLCTLFDTYPTVCFDLDKEPVLIRFPDFGQQISLQGRCVVFFALDFCVHDLVVSKPCTRYELFYTLPTVCFDLDKEPARLHSPDFGQQISLQDFCAVQLFRRLFKLFRRPDLKLFRRPDQEFEGFFHLFGAALSFILASGIYLIFFRLDLGAALSFILASGIYLIFFRLDLGELFDHFFQSGLFPVRRLDTERPIEQVCEHDAIVAYGGKSLTHIFISL